MQLIPPLLLDNNSNAEKKVFDIFKEIKIDKTTYLLHSVNLPYHKYKQWAEIDFLLISQKGILVFEVKGGRISRRDGVWYFKDRWDKEHRKSEGPDQQARSAMYAIKNDLQKQFPNIDFRNIPFGWGLIFPDIDYAAATLELPDELVCDESMMNVKAFKSYILGVYEHWNKKISYPKDLQLFEIDPIVKFIRPNLELVQSLKSRMDQTHIDQVRLTQKQYEILDSSRRSKRILCTGGAGTGKTFLAVELAKRKSIDEKKVLFVCKSPILHKFIKLQLDEYPVDVISVDELERLDTGSAYDQLIVDEGQDLLTLDILGALDELLKGGLESGSWRWFMDMNNQSGIESEVDKEGVELLEASDPAYIELTHNCRNTEEIVLQTQLNTGADIGVADIKGKGIAVKYEEVSSRADAIKKLEKMLMAWSKEVEVLNDIVILSPVEFQLSIASGLSSRWRDQIQVLDDKNVTKQDKKKILFSTIKQYKGLEKKIVAMIDLDKALETGEPDSFVYVGMTRSNSVLWIEVDETYKKYWEDQQAQNIIKMIGKDK